MAEWEVVEEEDRMSLYQMSFYLMSFPSISCVEIILILLDGEA